MFELSNNLKLIRKKWKLNQTDFASLFGLNKGNISNYERDQNVPDIAFFIRLQDLTGINAKALCYIELKSQDILDQPLKDSSSKVNVSMVEEPKVSYLSRQDLYDFHKLVEKVEELDAIVKELKKRIK